jgi:hypothetical protein
MFSTNVAILDSGVQLGTKTQKLFKIRKENSNEKKQLEQNWTIVDKPGPGTIRLRMALTEAEGASREMDIATTYLPPARLISEGTKIATGTHAFVGQATIELEVLDSIAKERLVAIVDKRSGGKHYEGSTDNWADVKQACDWWAQKMSTELQKRRAE